MKKGVVLILLFVVFFISIGFVSAFLVDECPEELNGKACGIVSDDSSVSKGTCYDQQCLKFKEVEVGYDPGYIDTAKKERLFDPGKQKEITPFDDIVCDVSINFPPGKHKEASNLKGRLVTKGENDETVVLKEGSFIYNSFKDLKDEEGHDVSDIASAVSGTDIYRWEIDGWPDGITTDKDKMDALVKDGNLKCEIVFDDGKAMKNPSWERKLNLCVHLWGYDGSVLDSDGNPMKAPFNIVTMRGKGSSRLTVSRIKAGEILNLGKTDMNAGYKSIDPFSEYEIEFSFDVDLKEHDNTNWEREGGSRSQYTSKANYNPQKASTCGQDSRIYNFYTIGAGYGYYSDYFVPFAFIDFFSLNIFQYGAIPTTAVHETGHAFGGLSDEYAHSGLSIAVDESKVKALGKNCRLDHTTFLPYGDSDDKKDLCHYPTTLHTFSGELIEAAYAPSRGSIMEDGGEFNVISCGYLLDQISKGSRFSPELLKNQPIEYYFHQCCSLGTIGPAGGCPSTYP
ncbi:hypothetical protein CMI45_00545 [Candidatus Pacearchaeota archaeon]|nr:hypothetical protein [Candidatus Pacearchaeota archaeon]|tara:strand:- start:1796 stop:3325 length:1530 start_codon:yes stop_codon:yes gene_type:complete